MSSVDERVVRMKFDNAQFEKGVEESLDSIDRLNKKLDSTESATAFEGISKAADNVDMSGIEKAVDHIADRFSVFGTIATTVLVNIANQAFQTGEALVKSLTVDNIMAGWEKYDQEVQAVQTIMVTLGDTTTMEEVEGQLEKLAWFSDETSYSYTQMTDSLAKFISAGMGMEDSVTAVMGLANAAAAAGVSTQKASSAFYNFSQAMGTGYMGLQDWRSIEMLNMATPQFKQNILDSAVALGKLNTTIGDTGETLYYFDKQEDAFSANGLRASLKDRWLDQDVMMDVLKRYGEFSDKVQELQSEYDYDQASNVIKDAEKLGLVLDTFSAKAFMAAQEAKTFQEAIDATKDAVSTKWKNTFEYIFGNYEEAKVLWTDFSEFLYNLFATSGDERNELLEKWKDLGGRDALIEGFYNIMQSILNIVNAIKDAWHDIFPPMEAERLVEITENFRDLTERMLITEERAETIKKVLTPVFRVIRFIVDAIKALFTQIKRLGPPLQNLLDKFKEIVGPLWDKLVDRFKNSSLFTGINTEGSFISKLIDFLTWCINKITEGIGKLQELLGPIWDKVRDKFLNSSLFSKFNTDGTFITAIANAFSEGFNTIKNAIGKLKEIKIDFTSLTRVKNWLLSFKENGLDILTKAFGKFGKEEDNFVLNLEKNNESLQSILTRSGIVSGADQTETSILGIGISFENLRKILSNFLEQLSKLKLGDILSASIFVPIFVFAFKLLNLINLFSEGFGKAVTGLISSIGRTFSEMAGILSYAKNLVKAKVREWNSKAILNYVLAISALIGAIILLSNFANQNNILKALDTISLLMIAFLSFVGIMNVIQKVLNKTAPGIYWSKNGISIEGLGRRTGLISMAASLLAIVLAIKFMNDILNEAGSVEKVWNIIGMLAAISAGLLVFATLVFAMGDGHRLGLQTFYPLVMIISALEMVRLLKKLDELHIENYKKTIGLLVGILTGLAVVSKFAGNAKSGSRAMFSVASSILVVVLAIKLINKVADEFTWKSAGISALVIGMLAIIGAISIIVDRLSGIKSRGLFKGQGSSILKVCLGLLAIVLILKAFKDVPWNSIWKGLLTFVVILGAISLVMVASGKAGNLAGKTIKSIASVITFLSISIALLSLLLKNDPSEVLKAAGIIAGLFGVIALALKFALPTKAVESKLSVSFLRSLTALFAVISLLLFGLYFLDDKAKMTQAAVVLALLFSSLAAIIHVLTKFSPDIATFQKASSVIITVAVLLGVVVAAVIALAEFARDTSQLPTAALAMLEISIAIGILMVAFAGFIRLAKFTDDFNAKAMRNGIGAFAVTLIVIIGSIIAVSRLADFDNLSKFNKDLALGILGFIGVVLVVQVLASLIGLIGIGPLAVGLIGITVVIVYLMLIMEGIAGWNGASDEELENFKNKIIKVGELFIILAKIVGLVIGYVLFGWLPALAEMLTMFAEGMKPFSDAINKLPDNFVDQVGKFGEAMLSLIWNLAIAHTLNVGLFGLGNVLKKFAEKLDEALPYLIDFFKQMSTVDGIDKATAAMDALAAIASSINNINPQGEFRLRNFGQDISGFFDYIKKINSKNIESVRYISIMLHLLSSDKIDYSHMDSQMAAAGNNAALFAESMTEFAQHTTNPQLYKTASETAPYLMSLIAQLSTSENAISTTSGLFLFLSQDIFSNGGIGNFGERLKSFTTGIYYYATMLSEMDMAMLNTAVARTQYIASIVEALSASEKNITPNSGLLSYIQATPDLAIFIANITNVIPALKNYISALNTEVTLNDLSNAVGRTELLAQVLNALSTANASFEKDNSGKLKNLAKALTGKDGIAAGIISYCTDITSYEGDIYKVSAITSQISNAIKSLVHADNTADIEAFNYALKRIVANGLDEWLEVFKEWPQQDKLNQAVQEFTDGIVTAFGLADNANKISESLLTPINNLLKALNAKGINFYNAGHNLTQQLLNGLNSLKLEYQSNLEEIKNIPTSILDTVSSEDVANNSALSFMADQLRDLTGAAQEAQKTVPTALEEVLTTTKELGVNVETGQNGRGLSDWFSGLKNKVGLNIDSNQILDTLGLNYESFDLTNLGTLSGETYSSGFMQSLLSNMSPETLDYTAYVDQFMSEMQASLDQYGIDTGGLTVDVMPVLSDGSTIADFEGIMGDMYGPNIQYNTDAITNLTEKVTVLNTKLDNLTSALNNQTIKHEGTINVKYTNQQGLVDSVTRAIIDNLRVGGRI